MRHWIATIALLTLGSSPAAAQITLKVCLDGGQVLPPVATNGYGQASVLADQVMNVVTVGGGFTNLSSNVVSADLVLGTAGSNGTTVLMPLMTIGATDGVFSGQMAMSQTDVGHVYWGRSYIIIRTAAHPNGEIRGQVAQRMTIDCPAAIVTDPHLSDISGDTLYGPKIGHAVEAFNMSLDCSNASPGPFVIVIKAAKRFPTPTSYGFLWVQGTRFGNAIGVHAQNVVTYAPADVVLPNDITLVGVQYAVQGFCGGRLSNALIEVVGIGM